MGNKKQKTESRRCEKYAKYEYKKSSYSEIFEALQSLHKDETFCDIKLETDDNKIINAHKVILASSSPYFRVMFSKFEEKNQDHVFLKELNSIALQLLVNFIYSGEITISEKNVQVLLPAANFLQLPEVQEACCDFLQTQMSPSNCIGINAIADLYSCKKLITSSESYIQQHFLEIVGGEEFLSLSSEHVIKLISSDKLTVPSEEKIFESVMCWVKHELDSRKCFLPQLMEHVRLPLTSKNYILNKVAEEPLIKNCLKCNQYVTEALNFHILQSNEVIPQNIRHKSRHGDKVIFVVGGEDETLMGTCSTEWFDPKMNQWHFGPQMMTIRERPGLAVIKDNLVFAVGGSNRSSIRSVELIDLSSESPYWKPSVDMLVKREYSGVGVINDYIYAVGGYNKSNGTLDSAEVFDYNSQEWRMVSSMSSRRSSLGIGVLNNLLYAVGGFDLSSLQDLHTVECYHPKLDVWTPVANMSVRRRGAGVGVLDGVLYAVGGHDGFNYLSSVETYTPSTGVWTSIPDMNVPRRWAGVVALDGLLYVVGGDDDTSVLASTECYNPITKSWSMVTASMNDARTLAGIVTINRPAHFNTC